MSQINTNIMQRFELARQADRKKHRDGEVAKLGNLRAGSSGIMNPNGDIAGGCHRKSHLRSLGIEIEEPTTDKLIMFELGYANEDRILELLEVTKQPGEIILREEEIPVEWLTSNGTRVTGRPDIVLCTPGAPITAEMVARVSVDKLEEQLGLDWKQQLIDASKPTPVLGLELKSVHSVWTAREVFFNKQPKLDNLIQSAHYMWKLGVPYKLIYRSYSQLGQGMGASEWMGRQFPTKSESIEYNEKTGKAKHVKQFEIVYDLKFDDIGTLLYSVEGEDKWISTVISRGDIERYFEYVSQMGPDSTTGLGPRPSTVNPQGEKANYKSCDYCPLKPVCDRADKEKLSYSDWLNSVKLFKKPSDK